MIFYLCYDRDNDNLSITKLTKYLYDFENVLLLLPF